MNVTKSKTTSYHNILPFLLVFISVIGLFVSACAGLLALDTINAPSGFTAEEGNMEIALSWTNETDSDRVLVRCHTDSYPAYVTEGELVYEGSETTYIHTKVEPGITYFYSIWSARLIDGEWVYSSDKKTASATPYYFSPDEDEEEIQEYEYEYVMIGSARLVGADGEYIELTNNPESHDPTWEELKQFLWQDETDQQLYDYSSFVCADFAEMLHNNAESAGIRAAYLSIDLNSSSAGHALNAFVTTDLGMVYLDSTGTMSGGLNADKTVNLAVGAEYIPVSIFLNPGYDSEWDSMGQVTEIWIQW